MTYHEPSVSQKSPDMHISEKGANRAAIPSQHTNEKWLIHRPFIPNVPQGVQHNPSPNQPSSANLPFTDHLIPFGTPIPQADPCKVLRICMQNTQHDFRLHSDGIEIKTIIDHLYSLGATMFVPISPNINWKNGNNWSKTRQLFRPRFKQIHLSAVSSDIGLEPLYLHRHLIGGSAILTFGLWASKVAYSSQDPSGHGSYTITTIQGKNNKFVSLIAAYISIQKGSEIGTESLFAQKCTIYENEMIKKGKMPKNKFCPRANAIKNLNNIISELQSKQHVVILMLDANQSLDECYMGKSVKPYSIEWLRLQRGMEDPFIQLMNSRPNSTTIIPNRDIDFILTYGIHVTNISTLSPNLPATSDHLGIILDIDLASHFSSSYSDLGSQSPRMLTSGNRRSVKIYTEFVSNQVKTHKLAERVQTLMEKASNPDTSFTRDDAIALNLIDDQLTSFMLGGEKKCARKHVQRQSWSPHQREIARTFSYWHQKAIMEAKKQINWTHLNQLHNYTAITEADHLSIDPMMIRIRKRESRAKWKACKKCSAQIRQKFLTERAEFLAMKMRTTEEKALKAILKVEQARCTFKKIDDILGINKFP
jgi:hypothetical protein